jgi:hypothetical protein
MALVAATLLVLLLALPAAGANFTNPTSSDANSFVADLLAPPTGLTAACGTTITLDWTATVDTYATGHRVFRSTTPGGPYSQIAQITPRTTVTYDDTPAAGTYYYVVRAYYLSWESVDGNEAEGATACTTDVSFNSIADTSADESKPTNNYGTNTTILVRSWQSAKDARSFVEFDVSSIPSGSTVNTATLTLCATRVPGSTRTIDLHRITASWVETTLTWNNQPSVAASVTDSTTTPGSPACMTWDVAADVQLWIDGTANEGWRAKDSVEGQGTRYITEFAARENGTPADRPILDVNYTP